MSFVAPDPVLRICSVVTSSASLRSEVTEELASAFGPVALESELFDFDETGYYRVEMGEALRRCWLCFHDLFPPEELAESRLVTGRLEEDYTVGGKRRVNLDPGYLDHGKLVLASTKEAPDKIYLGRGVWAHTCMRYRYGAFEGPDHSFPDFREGRYDAFLGEARRLYKTLSREAREVREGA